MTLRILTFGTDPRLEACRCALVPHAHALCSAFPALHTVCLFPIPTVTAADTLHIRTTDIPLASLAAPGTLAVGYGLPSAFAEAMGRAGGYAADVAEDDSFTQDNAYLTALGTLSYLLEHLTKDPSTVTVGIVGCGRIGQALCRLLIPLGTRLRVYTRREDIRHALGACGIDSADSAAPLCCDGVDVLINTAAAPELFCRTPKPLPPMIIDLASGKTLPTDIPHISLPSLPARAFPVGAGEALARCVLRMAQERAQTY